MNVSEEKNRDWRAAVLPYLPRRAAELLHSVRLNAPLEEIRIRADRPIQLCFSGGERLLYAADGGAPVSAEDCAAILRRFTAQSLYAWEEELRRGYLTLPGGCRVGLCGRAETEDGRVLALTDASAFNIRIAREVRGAAVPLMPYLCGTDGRMGSVLVVSAPGCGKTTLLRDVARCCSYGLAGAAPHRVAIADTRCELAGSVRGVPQMDVGPRTDVLSGGTRAEACRMLISNMSPDVLVTDELTSLADARAVYDAACSGVAVAASAHASCGAELLHRHALAELIGARLFRRIVLLGRSAGAGTVECMFDGALQTLERRGELCCAGSPH